MELFYNEHITSKSESFELNREETKHKIGRAHV